MIRFSFHFVPILFLALLPGCGGKDSPVTSKIGASGDPVKKTDLPGDVASPAPTELAALLKTRGYIEVPLILTKAGLLDVEVKINGQPLQFLLDTGAGGPVIDEAVAERLMLAKKKTDETLAGSSGVQPLIRSEDVQFSVGPNRSQEALVVSNLSAINAWRKKEDCEPCDGILDNKIMQLHGAVIDHSSSKLFLLNLTIIEGLNTKPSLNITLNEGRVVRALVVELPNQEPLVVTKTAFERLKPEMTFAQIGEVFGGELKKAHLTQSYTGTLAIVQGKSRIDLAFHDGKVVTRSAQGVDGLGAANASAGNDLPSPVVPPSATVLGEFLKARGYIEVPLIHAKDGLFDVKVNVNGQPLLFLVDTGASTTVIHDAIAKRLNLPINKTDGTFVGITGPQPLRTTVVEKLSVESISGREEPFVRELSDANALRKKRGLPPWDGYLGNDFLNRHRAVIDHTSASLFLLDLKKKE